jgi:endogenous inhibitor of DNA gyrase (YacG/DUF329 family)
MTPPACAVCAKRPSVPEYRPFCSKRCADVDLGRWLSDRYAIPAVDNEDTTDEGDDRRSSDH